MIWPPPFELWIFFVKFGDLRVEIKPALIFFKFSSVWFKEASALHNRIGPLLIEEKKISSFWLKIIKISNYPFVSTYQFSIPDSVAYCCKRGMTWHDQRPPYIRMWLQRANAIQLTHTMYIVYTYIKIRNMVLLQQFSFIYLRRRFFFFLFIYKFGLF